MHFAIENQRFPLLAVLHRGLFREESVPELVLFYSSIAIYILNNSYDHILGYSVLQTHISWLCVDYGNVKILALAYGHVISSEYFLEL